LLSALLQVGEQLKALVLNVDATRGRITLSTKQLEQEPGDFMRLSRKEFSERAEAQHLTVKQLPSKEKIAVGDLLDGVVTSLESSGAFLDVGLGVTALLHISQITHGRISNVKSVLAVRAIEPRHMMHAGISDSA
jgi:ribosomal protein S1